MMDAAALATRVEQAWVAAFGRPADAVTVHADAVHVEGLALYPLEGGRWGVGMVVTIRPEVPGELAADGVIPQAECNTVEEALFHVLTVASVADEARREMEGKRPRWEELMHGPF
jgi:hypothetical protein